MRTASRLRERWRIDPLACLVGVVALVVYALHGFNGGLSRDLGIYSYGAQQVADGVPPYVGILNRAGPLAHLIPAIGVAGARAGGIDDLLGMRLLFLVLSVACVCLVYLLGRDLFDSPLAGLAAAAAFLSFYGFIEYASNGPREKTAMVLFLLCALLAMVRQRWFVAGVFVGLATLTWQPVFLVGSTAVVVAAIGSPRSGRVRALVRFVVGGLVPTAVCLAYFAVVGALGEFIDAFLLINARYAQPASATTDLAKSWSNLQHGYHVSVWVIVAGLGALAVLAVSAVRRKKRRRDPSVISVAAVGTASLVGVLWTAREFNGWPDAFMVLPLAAIGIGGVAKQLSEHLSPRAAISLTLTWTVVAVSVALTYSIAKRGHGLEGQRGSVSALLEQLPADASIMSVQAPQALVLSGKTNPTRYQMFSGPLKAYLDDTLPGGLEGFGESVGRTQPTVVAVAGGRVPSWLADTIEREYRRAGRAPGWTWYVHRSVGPGDLSASSAASRTDG